MENLFKELNKLAKEVEKNREDGKQDYEQFVAKYWTNPSKSLPTIILGHIYVESCIDKLLEKSLKNPSKIRDGRFAHKVDILDAIGIIKPEITRRIRALNKARNKVAHNLSYSLDENLAKQFSAEPEDIEVWKKDPNKFMIGEISYIAGYLHSVIAGQRKIRSLSL